MRYSVDPDNLIASSRQLHRSTNLVRGVPASVRNALMTVSETCGDPGCAGLARNLAAKWQLALGIMVDGGASLAESISTAGGEYSRNERLVVTAMKVAQ